MTKAERNHELLLTVKNLRELGSSPFPYIIPIVPRSLLAEVIEGSPLERVHPLTYMVVPGLEDVLEIVCR